MNKTQLPCSVVQDLIPLCLDDCAAPESKELVESHIQTCPDCAKLYRPITLPQPAQLPPEDAAMKTGMKKVRRRWKQSLIAAVLLLPFLLLTFHQLTNTGVAFTNIPGIIRAHRYLSLVEKGDYEKSFDYLNVDLHYSRLPEGADVSPDEYREAARAQYAADMRSTQEAGYTLKAFHFHEAYPQNDQIEYTLIYEKDGVSHRVGICFFGSLGKLDPGGGYNMEEDEELWRSTIRQHDQWTCTLYDKYAE